MYEAVSHWTLYNFDYCKCHDVYYYVKIKTPLRALFFFSSQKRRSHCTRKIPISDFPKFNNRRHIVRAYVTLLQNFDLLGAQSSTAHGHINRFYDRANISSVNLLVHFIRMNSNSHLTIDRIGFVDFTDVAFYSSCHQGQVGGNRRCLEQSI